MKESYNSEFQLSVESSLSQTIPIIPPSTHTLVNWPLLLFSSLQIQYFIVHKS